MTTCDVCGDNEATISLKQVVNGTAREIHLCEECASKQGIEIPSQLGLADFLFGMEVRTEADRAAPEKTCKACGRKASDFQKDSRVGCQACYETFADELAGIIADVQPGKTHTGKVPATARIQTELAARTRELREAVAEENFEEAARLRDLIKDLKSGDEGASP